MSKTQINWSIPYTILQDPSYKTINIYQCKEESGNYIIIANYIVILIII